MQYDEGTYSDEEREFLRQRREANEAAGVDRPLVVWREDGKLVDATTATRPYEPPAHVKAEVQRILDARARRLLDEQLKREEGDR